MRLNEFWGRRGRVCVRDNQFRMRGHPVALRCPRVLVRGDRWRGRIGAMCGRGIRVDGRRTQIPGRDTDVRGRRSGRRERFVVVRPVARGETKSERGDGGEKNWTLLAVHDGFTYIHGVSTLSMYAAVSWGGVGVSSPVIFFSDPPIDHVLSSDP